MSGKGSRTRYIPNVQQHSSWVVWFQICVASRLSTLGQTFANPSLSTPVDVYVSEQTRAFDCVLLASAKSAAW